MHDRSAPLAVLAGFSSLALGPAGAFQEGFQVVYERAAGEAVAGSLLVGGDGVVHVLAGRAGIGSWAADGDLGFREVEAHPLVRPLKAGESFAFSPSRSFLGVFDHPVVAGQVSTRVHVSTADGERPVSIPGSHAVQISDDGRRLLFFEYGHDASTSMTLRILDLQSEDDPLVIEPPVEGIVRFSADASVVGVRQGESVAVYSSAHPFSGNPFFDFPVCHGFFLSPDGSRLASWLEDSIALFELAAERVVRALPPLPIGGDPVAVEFSEKNVALVLTRTSAWLHTPGQEASQARLLATVSRRGERYTSGAFLRGAGEGEAAVALGSRRVTVPALNLAGLTETPPGRALAEVTLLKLDGEVVAREEFALASWSFDDPHVRPLPDAGVSVFTPDRVLVAGAPR